MIFTFLREMAGKINAWQIRMVALTCVVLFVGGGSQVLVSAFAATDTPRSAPTQVVAQGYGDTVAGERLSCKAIIRRAAAGIDVDTGAHYAFTLHCTPNQISKRSTSSAPIHKVDYTS